MLDERHIARLLTVLAPAILTVCVAGTDRPDMPADLSAGWYARFDTTAGSFLARLLPDQAPQSVAHFAALAEGRLEWTDPDSGEVRSGRYYDGLPIQRIIRGKSFEAGRRPGARSAPELYVPEEGFDPVRFNDGPALGMTRLGRWISAVEFFVTTGPDPDLDFRFPCFAEIVSGLDVVRSIAAAPLGSDRSPETPLIIDQVVLMAVGEPPPLPEPVPYDPGYLGVPRIDPRRVSDNQ